MYRVRDGAIDNTWVISIFSALNLYLLDVFDVPHLPYVYITVGDELVQRENVAIVHM